MLLHADCIADYGWMHACETSFSIPCTAAPLPSSFTSRYTTASADAVFHAVAGLYYYYMQPSLRCASHYTTTNLRT